MTESHVDHNLVNQYKENTNVLYIDPDEKVVVIVKQRSLILGSLTRIVMHSNVVFSYDRKDKKLEVIKDRYRDESTDKLALDIFQILHNLTETDHLMFEFKGIHVKPL